MECSGQFITGKVSGTASVKGVVNKAIEYQVPYTQDKTITPTKNEQIVVPDEEYNALSKVVVEPIPNEYIIPSGDITITENGTYDVKDKESAIVNVGGYFITEYNIRTSVQYPKVQYMVKKIPMITVNIGSLDGLFYGCNVLEDIEPLIFTKPITSTSYMYNGCHKLKSFQDLDMSEVTNANSMYYDCYYLQKAPFIKIPLKITSANRLFSGCLSLMEALDFDTSNITDMTYMYQSCFAIKEIPKYDTSNVTSFYQWINCNANYSIPSEFPGKLFNSALEKVPELDASSCNNVYNMFGAHKLFTDFGGLKNLGQAYSTTSESINSNYTLPLDGCPALTHDSLINVINDLYDIATAGVKVQVLRLGATNIAKLTEEEIKIATDKGWTVS